MAVSEMNYVEGGGGKSSILNVGKPTSATQFANIGFRPKRITISDLTYNSSHKIVAFYDEDYSLTNFRYFYDSNAIADNAMASNTLLTSVTDNGFTLNATYISSYASTGMTILVSPV